MSIWSHVFGFSDFRDDPPYAEFQDASGHYTTNDPASLASTKRGGFFDVARSGSCGLIRFGIEEADNPGYKREAEIWLDRRQVTALRDALTGLLETPDEEWYGSLTPMVRKKNGA